jgi:hypothetical protein
MVLESVIVGADIPTSDLQQPALSVWHVTDPEVATVGGFKVVDVQNVEAPSQPSVSRLSAGIETDPVYIGFFCRCTTDIGRRFSK